MTYTTQCPDCQTCFKVTSSQLAIAKGLVRCGRCSYVFDAQDYLVQIEPIPPAHTAAHTVTTSSTSRGPSLALEPDEFQLEVPDFDPKTHEWQSSKEAYDNFYASSHANEEIATLHTPLLEPRKEEIDAFQRALKAALQQPAVETQISHTTTEEIPAPFAPDDSPLISDAVTAATIEPTTPAASFTREPQRSAFTDQTETVPRLPHASRRRWKNGLFALLSTLGVVALGGQLIFFNRARIATEIPELRAPLDRVCQALGCTVPLPTDLQFIRTEWSDCPQLPDHPHILQLQAKIKNRAPYPQAWPMMELTLKDADNRVLIRKIFTPREYLKTEDYNVGRFHANSDAFIDLLFDSGNVSPRGYSIYWFYP